MLTKERTASYTISLKVLVTIFVIYVVYHA